MTDAYQYWRAHLAGDTTADQLGELMLPTIGAKIPGENPQPGYYKVRLGRGEPHVLMQIWLVDESGEPVNMWRPVGLELRAVLGRHSVPPQELAERWLFAVPVSRQDGAHWREHGRWPGDAPPLTGALPPRTHNQPTDPYALVLGEAHERIEQAKTRLAQPIADQTACDMARNLQAELLALGKRADSMHEVEKRPHLEAGRAVDRRYDFRAVLADWAGKLREAFGAWMAAEEARRQAEANARYAEARAAVEAERESITAERAKAIEDDPIAALTSPEPALPPLPVAPEAVKVQSGGGVGRRAGLKDDWDIEITDYKLAALRVIEDPDVCKVVGKVLLRVVRAAKGRIEIPGVKITEVRRVA